MVDTLLLFKTNIAWINTLQQLNQIERFEQYTLKIFGENEEVEQSPSVQITNKIK